MIPTLIVDSTKCCSDLCDLGRICRTDKSPYNDIGHRHPYTGIYSLLFSQYREKEVRFSEIGIATGASVEMWNLFFKNASFYFFDRDINFLHYSKQHVKETNNKFLLMNVSDKISIKESLEATGGSLDVLLDDSSHNIDDQNNILHEALPFIKSGGMIIIEDIDRKLPDIMYETILEDIKEEFSFITFIQADHDLRYSPGWDNDKLLVLIKK